MTTETKTRAGSDRASTHDQNEVVPRALRGGVLRFGEIEVPCYVLANGTALLTSAGITRIFASSREGNLSGFVARISRDSSGFSLLPSLRFRLHNDNAVAKGYPSDTLIDVCSLYVRSLAAGTLHAKQVPLAARAVSIVTACAKTGIVALIWESTGYDKVKAAGALQDKLAATLRHEAGRWERMFSPEFFSALAKVFRIELGSNGRRPMCFAAFLAEFFYEWFDADVYAAVKTRNPRRPEHDGAREYRHHQFLTDYARERFRRHQRDVLLLMRASTGLIDFRMKFDAAFRGGPLQLSFGGAQ